MPEPCEHFEDIQVTTSDLDGCQDCLAQGRRDWVELRLCLVCGHVGCCDNSPGRHMTAHHHETGHTVIRGFMPGNMWIYCYPHDFGIEGYFPPIQKNT